MKPVKLSLGLLVFSASLASSAAVFAQTAPGMDASIGASPPPPAAVPVPPPATPPVPCAGLTGAARADCERMENATNALCFGMSAQTRADCERAYNPNRFGSSSEAAPKPDTGATLAPDGGDTGIRSGPAGTGSTSGAQRLN